jgi:DNA-binding NarL/FixJ family response regulator
MPGNKQSRSRKARVYLVDDEPVVLRGLQLLLGGLPQLEVCGTARHASDARAQVQMLAPDLAVVDLNLGRGEEGGLTLLRQLRQLCPGMKLLVFSMHAESATALAAFQAGAAGYVSKEEGTTALLEALDAVLAGRPYFSPLVAAELGKPGRDAAPAPPPPRNGRGR